MALRGLVGPEKLLSAMARRQSRFYTRYVTVKGLDGFLLEFNAKNDDGNCQYSYRDPKSRSEVSAMCIPFLPQSKQSS